MPRPVLPSFAGPSTARLHAAWRTFAILAFATLAVPLSASRVAVRGQVDAAHPSDRQKAGGKSGETYVFYPGKFFSGHIPDRTLETLPFREIAVALAHELARQSYLPAASLEEADLILVVHWGVTMGYDRSAALFAFSLDTQTRVNEIRDALGQRLAELAEQGASPAFDAQAISLTGQLNDSFSTLDDGQSDTFARVGRDLAVTSNAGLLGIADLLHSANQSVVVTASNRTLNSMLDEDRYFVVVMAYDRKSLIEKRTIHRRWSTRLSMRAPGNNFRTALAALAAAGGDEFGRETPGLTIRQTKRNEGRVDIGEVVVVGEAPAPPANRESD